MVVRVLTAAEDGGDGEEGDAGEPEVHAEALAGAGGGDGGERRVGCPAGDGGAAGDEGGGEEGERGRAAVSQKASGVEAGKAMRRLPIWAGRMRLPKPDCGATVRTKKSIRVPWRVTRAR